MDDSERRSPGGETMEQRGARQAETVDERRGWGRRTEEEETDEGGRRGPPSRGERVVAGAETGVRRAAQTVALLLWAPVGLAFWLPLLLRRTVGYVIAVLQSGLTGSDPEGARRRWAQAVDFYRVGFQRIVRAFGDEERFPRPGGESGPAPAETRGSLPGELVWAAAVWTAALWLLGVWPEAPAAIGGAAAGAWDSAVELGRELLRRLP